ncbi:hypothetical protein [Garicola koreensis]|uniref:Uncharacterized protein n=1 Tax=Garicola koreensis TaxID=1262554 RepID=A0A7W5TV43_9MICC|nr:hypothetical protein [Garicola koreensis]MBB3667829.1 hypothetical protein [Garicola koreensis]
MSSDRPRTEPGETPEPAVAPESALAPESTGAGEHTSAEAEADAAETAPRKVHPPQAPAALGGMGSTGPITIVSKRR